MELVNNTPNEEANVLQYVKTFKSLSQSLKQDLDKLLALKRDQTQELNKQEFSTISDKSFGSLVELRTNHRDLYLGVEKSRLETQKEKERIDMMASELEELTYLRDSIMSEINISKNRNFPQLGQLESLNAKVKEADNKLTPNNIKESHDHLINEFSQELDKRKKIKLEYETKEEDKNGLIKKCEEDKNFLTKIPQHIQKISDSCKPLQNLYKTGVSTNYDQIQISKNLPMPLYWLYKKLVALKEAKLDDNVEIELKENAEAATRFGFFKIQIVLSIFKDRKDPSLKKYSELLNEKSFFSGAYPLKLYFSLLPTHDLVLVNLETKNFFTADEILSRIIENDVGAKIFKDPKTDVEKSINNKFSLYSWIQDLCKEGKTVNLTEGGSNNSPKIASLVEIIKAIRTRVVNRLLLKHQFDNLRTNKQFPAGVLKLFEMEEMPKFDLEIVTLNKVSKEDYLKWIEVPSFLKDDEESSDALLGQKKLSEKVQDVIHKKQTGSTVRIYGHDTSSEAYKKQTHIEPGQIGLEDKEDFYRVEFSHPKYKVIGHIIVDFDYPNREPKMVFKISMESPKEVKIPEEIKRKFNGKAVEQIKKEQGSVEHRLSPLKYDILERSVNQKVTLPDQSFIFAYKVLVLMITMQKHLA